MPSDSILDAAFSGFRLVRERPRAMAVWAAAQLVFALVLGLLTVLTGGAALTRLTGPASQARADPGQALALLGQVAPMYLMLMLASALFYAVFLAAANRAVLQPDDARLGYLRVGADELRQLGLIGALVLVAFGVYLVIGVVLFGIAVVIGGVGAATGIFRSTTPGAAGAGIVTATLIAFIIFLLVAAAMVFVWVRLSLASPLTFAKKQIDVFGSWRLTRGRFWPIFGTYALVWVILIIVYLVGFVLILAVGGVIGGASGMAMLFRPDLSSVDAYFSPARLVLIVLQTALSALLLPVTLCPAIDIYRRIHGPSDLAAVFS